MRVLVTAGNTVVPIDRVRCITNVFTGRTGTSIALHGHARNHAVTLLTSHPELVGGPGQADAPGPSFSVHAYRSFEDLETLMQDGVRDGRIDAVIHCAAVTDYRVGGVYRPASGTRFIPSRAAGREDGHWETTSAGAPALEDRAAGKVKSDEPELWVRLMRTPKLIDLVRGEWGFRGVLVKFKLEVDLDEDRLLEVAERSRRQSAADLMVANLLETGAAAPWAYVGPVGGTYRRVARQELPARLFEIVERLHEERNRG